MRAVLLSFAFVASCNFGDDRGFFFNADPEGLWTGTLTRDGTAVRVEGFVQDGDLFVFGLADNVFLRGPIAVRVNSLTGTATLYKADDAGVPSATDTASLTGTVRTRSTMTGSFTVSDGVQGSLALNYSLNFEKSSSLNLVAGIWSRTVGAATRTMTVQNDGVLNGADTTGCVYNGALSIIDPDFNTYRMTVTVGNCGVRDGSYTGYAELTDTTNPNDTLVFAFANATHADAGSLLRQ